MIIGIVLILIAAAILLSSKKKKGELKLPASMKEGWYIEFSSGTPKRPPASGSGWAIDVPPSPDHLNYVQWFDAPKMALGGSLRIRYRVEGGPILQCENGQVAAAGLMVQRKGDTLSARGQYSGYRWFSQLFLPLEAGEYEFTVPLADAEWGPTMGRDGAASFKDCLDNAENLSIVFGGTGGRGHGVYGAGRFTLVSLEVL